MIALTAAVYFFRIPNPNMILIAGLTVCTTLYGYIPGILCGAEMIGYSLYFFSVGHSFVNFTSENLLKVMIITIGVALNVAFIGRLKSRHDRVLNRLEEYNSDLLEDNLSLREATVTDPLTKLKNRYALRRDFDRCFGRFIHVMMMDLDDFKGVNDTYGHEAGDELLRETGVVLRESFGNDSCYRYGGDEFIVICTDITEEHFRERIEEITEGFFALHPGGSEKHVRFSAGYVYGKFAREDDLRHMLRQADELLYQSKQRGKGTALGAEYRSHDYA